MLNVCTGTSGDDPQCKPWNQQAAERPSFWALGVTTTTLSEGRTPYWVAKRSEWDCYILIHQTGHQWKVSVKLEHWFWSELSSESKKYWRFNLGHCLQKPNALQFHGFKFHTLVDARRIYSNFKCKLIFHAA